MRAAPWIAALAIATCAACARYDPAPLPDSADLVREVSQLKVALPELPTAALRAHRFDPSDGLDIVEVAMLAVANSPELRAARAAAGVTRAQAFAAGLLPDPQLALGAARALGSQPGATTAWNAGLSLDVSALLARSTRLAAAREDERQVNLSLLWQEWQVAAQAELLFIRLQSGRQALDLLEAEAARLQQRRDRALQALGRGLVTRDTAGPLEAALLDTLKQAHEARRQSSQWHHDLSALLGLDPALDIPLVGEAEIAAPDAARIEQALREAPRRRPDLLALQAGYAAQDERLRGAIQAQFPALVLGPTLARDTGGVRSAGLALTLSLPLFDRNQGTIAIERATRVRLAAEYQQRLDASATDAHRLLAEQRLLQRQLDETDRALPALETAAARADAAFSRHDLDALALTTTTQSLLARRLERVALEQALREQAVNLQALLGLGLDDPASALPSPSPSPPPSRSP